jgi:hypothetical protein
MPTRTLARRRTTFPHAKIPVTQITATRAHARNRGAAVAFQKYLELFHAHSFARQTPNMALPFALRN